MERKFVESYSNAIIGGYNMTPLMMYLWVTFSEAPALILFISGTSAFIAAFFLRLKQTKTGEFKDGN